MYENLTKARKEIGEGVEGDRMKITLEWLEKERACSSGVEWFKAQKKSEHDEVINSLVEENLFDWANWTIVRLMTHSQKIEYAIFAAEQVIDIFEKQYPDDKRPRNAITAAKKVCAHDTLETWDAARDAAGAAGAAANAAYAAADSAYAAANAAYAAANSANAAYAAANAAYAAYAAADSAKKKLQEKIIKFGLKILEEVAGGGK
jgi:hypothetical protein